MRFARSAWAVGAELTLAGLIVCQGSFSVFRLVLLLLLASQSLWIRGLGWADLGLRLPVKVWRTIFYAVLASFAILAAIRFAIVPFAVFVTGETVDFSALGGPGDVQAFWLWLGQAWTLAAFGEEMVFRAYLMRRVTDLVGDTRIGWLIAVLASSALFGLAHRYLGWAGVIATGIIGSLVAALYLWNCKNLAIVIVCHGVVDTVALAALYFGRSSLLLP